MNNNLKEIKSIIVDRLAETQASDEIIQYYLNELDSIERSITTLEFIKRGLAKIDLDKKEKELTLKISGISQLERIVCVLLDKEIRLNEKRTESSEIREEDNE